MRNIVLVDIDGTITKVGDRVECLKAGNWKEFYARCGEDKPNYPIAALVSLLQYHYDIVFCTGRTESCRKNTIDWLKYHTAYCDNPILMRPDGDRRHDTILKPLLLEQAGIKLDEIAFVLEDRNSVVKKWRELGLTVLQVADGDF